MIAKERKKLLIIIDSNALIHRAFHALPPLTTKKGELVNAVYGFLLVFLKAIKEFQPDFIAAAFDLGVPTFRHKEYELYKATRKKAPQELYDQIPRIKEILEAFNVKVFEKEEYEADDIIGTISSAFLNNSGIETVIITGDLDALQLVNKNTKVYTLKKGVKDTVLYDEKLVKEKYKGLNPEQLVDFKGLRGDPSDNIPGVAGIGEKTALELIKNFKTIENLYKEIKEVSEKSIEIKTKLKELLIKSKKQAFLSRDLARIKKDVPIKINLEQCRWKKYDKERVIKALEDLDFHSLIPRLKEL